MQDFKISVITVVYNAQETIERCIISVLKQKFSQIQYIVIDGGSTDNTVQIINKYKDNIAYFVSEPDLGIYDGMNKGIALATGDIVGTLNADDIYTNDEVLNNVALAFTKRNACILYGDLDYTDRNGETTRQWRSGEYKNGMFNWGWMPPHPTFYCRRHLFEELGNYKLNYGSAADYELMVRFIHRHQIEIYYLRMVMVKMAIGGTSNKTIGNRIKALQFDLKAMRNNHIAFPFITIIFKPLRKLKQFFNSPGM